MVLQGQKNYQQISLESRILNQQLDFKSQRVTVWIGPPQKTELLG